MHAGICDETSTPEEVAVLNFQVPVVNSSVLVFVVGGSSSSLSQPGSTINRAKRLIVQRVRRFFIIVEFSIKNRTVPTELKAEILKKGAELRAFAIPANNLLCASTYFVSP